MQKAILLFNYISLTIKYYVIALSNIKTALTMKISTTRQIATKANKVDIIILSFIFLSYMLCFNETLFYASVETHSTFNVLVLFEVYYVETLFI